MYLSIYLVYRHGSCLEIRLRVSGKGGTEQSRRLNKMYGKDGRPVASAKPLLVKHDQGAPHIVKMEFV